MARPLNDFLQAGRAGAAAAGAVRTMGGTSQAMSAAGAAAFADTLKQIDAAAAAASKSGFDAGDMLKSMTGGLKAVGTAARQVSFDVYLMTRSFHLFGRLVGELQQHVVTFVNLANPAAVVRFNIALDDLHGVIGRMLVPVLLNATLIVQRMADYLWALTPAAKQFIAGLAGAAVGMAVASAAVMGLGAAVYIALSLSTGGIYAVVGGLLTLAGTAAGAATGFLAAGTSLGRLDDVLHQLGPIMNQVIEAIGPAMTQLFEALGAVIRHMLDGGLPALVMALEGVAILVEALAKVLKWTVSILGPTVIKYAAFSFVLFGMAGVVTTLTIAFVALGVVMFAVAWPIMLIGAAIGYLISRIVKAREDAAKPPGKAPPAVRPIQTGDMASFLNRQYAAALQGMPKGETEKDILVQIKEQMAKVNEWLEWRRQQRPAVGNNQLPVPEGGQPGMGPGQWQAIRAQMAQVGGK